MRLALADVIRATGGRLLGAAGDHADDRGRGGRRRGDRQPDRATRPAVRAGGGRAGRARLRPRRGRGRAPPPTSRPDPDRPVAPGRTGRGGRRHDRGAGRPRPLRPWPPRRAGGGRHRIGGQDVGQGPAGCGAGPPLGDGRRRPQLQQRARRAADAAQRPRRRRRRGRRDGRTRRRPHRPPVLDRPSDRGGGDRGRLAPTSSCSGRSRRSPGPRESWSKRFPPTAGPSSTPTTSGSRPWPTRTPAGVVRYGEAGDVRAEAVRLDDELRPAFRLVSAWGGADVRLGVRGAHMVSNALAAAAAGFVVGLTPEAVAGGLAAAELSPWRMELHRTPPARSSSTTPTTRTPLSMRAALRALAALPSAAGGRRVAVLGSDGRAGPGRAGRAPGGRRAGRRARDRGRGGRHRRVRHRRRCPTSTRPSSAWATSAPVTPCWSRPAGSRAWRPWPPGWCPTMVDRQPPGAGRARRRPAGGPAGGARPAPGGGRPGAGRVDGGGRGAASPGSTPVRSARRSPGWSTPGWSCGTATAPTCSSRRRSPPLLGWRRPSGRQELRKPTTVAVAPPARRRGCCGSSSATGA